MAPKNIPTTSVGKIPENQKQLGQIENPTKTQETTVRTKAMNILLMLQLAVGGSGVAMAADLPKDMSVKSPDAKELVVGQNGEQKMLDELGSLTDDFIIKYNSINANNKKVVLKYYNDNHEKGKITLKITYQLTDLFYNIQENDKFRKKFSSLIVDGKFIGDESIVDDVKKLPKSLRGIYANLIKLDPNIKNVFGESFDEFLTVIDKNKMMFGEVIEQLKEQRVTKKEQDVAKKEQDVAKKEQDVAKKEQDVAKKEQDVAKHEELLKALERNSALYEKFLNDFNKIEGVVN